MAGAIGAAVTAGALLAAGPAAHAFADTAHAAGAGQTKHATSHSVGSEARKLTPAVRAKLDRAILRVMHQAKVPGAVVSLSVPGKGDYVRAFGVADTKTRAPMSTNVNMRVGSVTKTFTATAVLQLVDQKKVHLDDPISKYVRGVPQGDHITLRHLMEMRSGLTEYMDDEDFVRAWVADPHRQWRSKEFLPYAFKHGVEFAPGTKYHYSNTNYVLLGMVVEKVSGQPLGRYLQKHILGPAHLKHTFYPKGAEFPAPHAHGYADARGPVEDATNWNPHSIGAPAGAMISTLADLQRWAPILAKGTLLKHATQAERLKTLPVGIDGLGYGLGIFNDNGWIGHNGSLPGYQSLTVYLPEAKATLVVHATTDIRKQPEAPTTLLGRAVTRIATPNHVFDIKPAAPQH